MSTDSYPVVNAEGVIPDSALDRLGAWFETNYPNAAKIDDPFLADVRLALAQASMGFMAMQLAVEGKFSSCEHEPKYAGGVVSEGNRIYTPAEGMAVQLELIRSLG